MKQQDTYKEVKTFHYSNAVVRVHIPDLSPSEREQRIKEIGKAAARLVLSKNEN